MGKLEVLCQQGGSIVGLWKEVCREEASRKEGKRVERRMCLLLYLCVLSSETKVVGRTGDDLPAFFWLF